MENSGESGEVELSGTMPIALSDLKVGDAVDVAGTKTADKVAVASSIQLRD